MFGEKHMGPISVMLVWYYNRISWSKEQTYTVDVGEGCEIPSSLKNISPLSVELDAVPHLNKSILGV